jgi:two-component system cell cycle sensor histidine kinase/response regulator CckA
VSIPGSETILIVEDDESTAELLRRTLARAARTARIVDRVGEATKLMGQELFSLIILDYCLKDGFAWPVLDAARASNPRIPVIVTTGMGDEKVAAEAIHRGASDYVIKSGSFWEHLPGVVDRILRLAEAERGNSLLAAIVESSDDAIIGRSLDGFITSWNAGAERLYGYPARDAIGKTFNFIVPKDRLDELETLTGRLLRGESTKNFETIQTHKNGNSIEVSISVSPIRNKDGQIVGGATIARDISTRKRLEDQLLQAQKMEVVGRLAGGIAHDFNNLLTPIIGYSELMLEDLPPGNRLRGDIEEIRRSGRRAADLTRQLLAFSRKQVLQPKVLDLNEVVLGTEKLIRRLIGEDVRVQYSLAPRIGKVKVDPGQLEQVVMNLAVNSRDAMPAGGALTIETADVSLDPEYAKAHPEVVPGPHSVLIVSDSGTGMDKETLSHLFEPFFTTKPKGKGTGLGLATVYGIVKQSRGHIYVYSEPAHGTTFKVYFPHSQETLDIEEPIEGPRLADSGTETILLVEDDEALRTFTAKVLTLKGYLVLIAASGDEALALSKSIKDPLHLILTDVVMPGISGREAARQIKGLWPDVRILFMSGYTENAIVHHGVLDSGTHLLQKPFTAESLAKKVRQVLDSPGFAK